MSDRFVFFAFYLFVVDKMSARKRNVEKITTKEPSVMEILSKAMKAEAEWTDKVKEFVEC